MDALPSLEAAPSLDAAALDRFREDVAKLFPQGQGRVGLAVSGGPDSLALLLLAHATLEDVEAATVDHGLRPEGAEEARFVAALCAKLGVPHRILRLTQTPKGNVSSWARTQRYAALAAWQEERQLCAILTAHHADDQLETLIMRMNRGSGVSGLAGIRSVRGAIARPLLGWRKQALEALAKAAGLSPVQDPSNEDDRFDRARLRKALAEAPWLDALGAARTAQALASADAALDWAAQQEWTRRRARPSSGTLTFDAQGLPQDLLRRTLLLCLMDINPEARPRDDEVLRLLATLEAGSSSGGHATLAGVKCTAGPLWTFSPAPPHRAITRNS